jgi:DNA-binding NarL/FixJ family response regulator
MTSVTIKGCNIVAPTQCDEKGKSLVRILVVEDSAPFRKFICSILAANPDLQVIGEISDGQKAVQQADKLQPDLILLDIGLETINGIETARRTRKLAPNSRIIFLTQESDAEVVQEAFNTGACGYVLKARAKTDLEAAIEAALDGRRYISEGLAGPTRP